MAGDRGREVLLVRHGETRWSLAGRHTSRTDLELTARGREEAALTARRLDGRHFDLVLSSPLIRARETCRIAGYGDAARVRDDLTEWDYGDYEGLTTPQIRDVDPGWTLWSDGCPGGESGPGVAARVDRVIAEIRAGEGDTIVFAHGHVLRVFAARWMQMGPDAGGRLALTTAAVSVLGSEHETSVIWLWNDAGHLTTEA
jgi:probable phosphoglycerate mutase